MSKIVGNTVGTGLNPDKFGCTGGGANGITPHIGANGNWFIGDEDTGVKAQGTSGVYVGSGDMPDDCNLKINPNGIASIYNPDAKTDAMTFPVGVDENGKLWAEGGNGGGDAPTGGGIKWELLSYTETTERVNAISVPFGLEDQNTNYQIMVYVPPSTEDITNVGKCSFYIGKLCFMECIMSSNSSNIGTALVDIASCSKFSIINSIYGGAGLAAPASKQARTKAITQGIEFKIVPSTDTTKEFEVGTKIWIWAAKKGSEVQ